LLSTLLLIAAVVFGAVALLVLAPWWFQERIVFQPPRAVPVTPRDVRVVSYEAEDGQALRGYLINGDSVRGSALVLAFHGNADLAAWLIPWARELRQRTGVAVFLAEYRGYGGLTGRPTYRGVQADARAALSAAQETLGVSLSRCVLFGHSLGSAVAAELAEAFRPAALVLQSPFTSARAMAKRVWPVGTGWLWNRLSRVHFDSVRVVAQLDCPVFVAHGERDLIVPVAMGRQVFAAARTPGALLLVPDAAHNDVPEVGQGEYWSWISAAVRCGAASPDPRNAPAA